MMDWFARVHAKATGQLPVLRPRVVSWYAQPSEADPALPDAPQASATAGSEASPALRVAPRSLDASQREQETSAPPRPPERERSPSEGTVRTAAPEPERTVGQRVAPRRRRATRDMAEPPPARAEPQTPVAEEAPLLRPAPARAPMPDVPARDLTVQPPRRREVLRPPREEAVAGPAAAHASILSHPPRAAQVEPIAADAAARGSQPVLPVPPPAPLLVVKGPSPATLLPVRAARRDARVEAPKAEAPAPAPVIEVTIGRVEVRAVPERETARTAPATPHLSLDEYLRRPTGASS